jgi:hypothetical protein
MKINNAMNKTALILTVLLFLIRFGSAQSVTSFQYKVTNCNNDK